MVSAVSRLKGHPGIWRVDGYNNLKIYPKSAPRVYISLSEILEEGIHSSLYKGKATGKQIWLNQPLSRISDLLIGSCWRGGHEGGGKRINRLPPMEKTFTVDTSKIQIVSLNEAITINGCTFSSVLPKSAIELQNNYKQLKNSLYAVVPVLHDSQTQFLVTSCYELYRAYIGVSSRFINNIAFSDLSQYMTWENEYLKLQTTLNLLERFVAYRGHCSQEGRDWFATPSNHIKHQAALNKVLPEDKKQRLFIKSIFPFSGRTTLTVAGKPFKNTNRYGDSVWCVFAANLLHCSKAVSFIPKIAFSTFSNNPLPYSQDDIGHPPPPDDDPFDDEDRDDTDDMPNVRGRNIAILNSSNFFAAMDGLPFEKIPLNDTNDPLYENELGQPFDTTSQDEIDKENRQDGAIPQESEFDSQVSHIDRKLSDFIKMVINLRVLLQKREWEVITRSHQSALTIQGESVATFLSSNNKRKTWHLISEGEGTRLRQIVWVEIAVSEKQFIYLMEMELKESEKGRSTQVIYNNNFGYMDEADFKTFLNMTAAQNKWPTAGYSWKNDKAKKVATEFFRQYSCKGISHPPIINPDSAHLSDKEVARWAEGFESKLLELFQIE